MTSSILEVFGFSHLKTSPSWGEVPFLCPKILTAQGLRLLQNAHLLAIPVLFLTINKIKRWNAYNRWLLTGIVAGGPLSLLAIELGWFYAEVGRQPWIIRGYMKVSDAVTTNPNVGVTFWLFAALYALLGVICLFVLGRLFRNKPAEMELEERRIIL